MNLESRESAETRQRRRAEGRSEITSRWPTDPDGAELQGANQACGSTGDSYTFLERSEGEEDRRWSTASPLFSIKAMTAVFVPRNSAAVGARSGRNAGSRQHPPEDPATLLCPHLVRPAWPRRAQQSLYRPPPSARPHSLDPVHRFCGPLPARPQQTSSTPRLSHERDQGAPRAYRARFQPLHHRCRARTVQVSHPALHPSRDLLRLIASQKPHFVRRALDRAARAAVPAG